ncbi:hypothetical protein GJU40_12765 [Bacillus lacus]|uniref:YwpF-like protein n=1 Tax=Metabacillus lacus TaxID=1983721 RepID=A0A7X2LZJ6_9BACI|nr:YwpF family protein [Metabacillus lacus]MRX73013.1 hypothetical protein [Metabacillus lacus]
MKTFKLVGLKVEQSEQQDKPLKEYPLSDGLIINREDGENRWMIEALLDKTYESDFAPYHAKNKDLCLYVTISKKGNNPAKLQATISSMMTLDNHVSILFEGKMLTSRSNVDPEELLKSLVDDGLSGDALLETFNELYYEKRVMSKS